MGDEWATPSDFHDLLMFLFHQSVSPVGDLFCWGSVCIVTYARHRCASAERAGLADSSVDMKSAPADVDVAAATAHSR